MKIVLVGFMAAGKTTCGKKLAKALNLEFFDMDEVIENEYKISVSHFFEKYDESAFRKAEEDTLKKLLEKDNVVISTGGGTPCFYKNMKLILKESLCIYIRMHPKSLYTRLINAKKIRPLVERLSGEELYSYIQETLNKRKEFYEKAHIITKGEVFDINSVVQIINNHPLI